MIQTTANAQQQNKVLFKTIKVNGQDIFYREAGNKSKPTILLLHGFPTSSHMFRGLINDLSNSYHLIAPDYIGYGQSSAPPAEEYNYTYDNIGTTMEKFIDAVGLKKYSLYMFDIGGPVGFRIASKRPTQVQAIIIQNTTVCPEGADAKVAKPLFDYMSNPNPETEKVAKVFFQLSTLKWLYTDGAENAEAISPDGYYMDYALLQRAGNDQIQLEYFRDYGNNIPLYTKFQEYLRKYQPNTLVISGKNDKLFLASGAELFKKDVKNTQISLLNGGHFVLEEKHKEAAALIKGFLSQKGIK
jgi:pimeloyl-ACP methyl ester carboxylesterase